MIKANWMLWQWFSFETLEKDGIITNLIDKCQELRDAQSSLYSLTKYFETDFKKGSEFLSNIEADSEGDLAYSDKVIKILWADKSKLFYSHPYVHYLFKKRLASLWRNLAKSAGVGFYSVSYKHDETLEKYQWFDSAHQPSSDSKGNWEFSVKAFCSASLKPGKYIVFCNPMRHWGDCQVWENKHEGKYVEEMGVLAATKELLSELGCNPYRSILQLIPAEKYPNLVAEIESWEPPPKVNNFPDRGENFSLLQPKSKPEKTEILLSLIGKARALGVEKFVLAIPNNQALGATGNKEMSIIEFLSQELSINSDYLYNDSGLRVVGDYIRKIEANQGYLAAPFINSLQDKAVYADKTCAVNPNAVDTISRIITIVNNNWEAQKILSEEVNLLDFTRTIFNNPPFSSFDAKEQLTPIYQVAARRCDTYTSEIIAAYRVEEGFAGKDQVNYSERFRQVLVGARARLNHDLETITSTTLSTSKNPATGETYSRWEWAQAYWFKLHASSKHGRGSTSLVFNLFIDEILEELSKLQAPELINLPPIPFYNFHFAEFPHNWTRGNTPVGEILTIIFETTPDKKLGIRAKDSDNKFQFLAKVSESYIKRYYKSIVRGQEYLCYIFLIQHENDKIDKRKSLIHERSASDKPKGGLLVSAEVNIRRAVAAVRSQAGVEHRRDLYPNWILPWQDHLPDQ